MKKQTSSRKRSNGVRVESFTQGFANAADNGGLVPFVAARATDWVDLLHQQARAHIDSTQETMTQFRVDTLWQRALPLITRAVDFAKLHPQRAGLIVALLAGAALLTRVADSGSD